MMLAYVVVYVWLLSLWVCISCGFVLCIAVLITLCVIDGWFDCLFVLWGLCVWVIGCGLGYFAVF